MINISGQFYSFAFQILIDINLLISLLLRPFLVFNLYYTFMKGLLIDEQRAPCSSKVLFVTMYS